MSFDIIEVLRDGKYRLFDDNLKRILLEVKDCDKFAVFAIIGAKGSGKSFFQNCVIDYIKCEDKNSWPKDRVIDPKNGFHNNTEDKRLVKIFSEPLIVESNGEKIAVILMDTNNLFTTSYFLSYKKTKRDIISLMLSISSTLIFLKEIALGVSIRYFVML